MQWRGGAIWANSVFFFHMTRTQSGNRGTQCLQDSPIDWLALHVDGVLELAARDQKEKKLT